LVSDTDPREMAHQVRLLLTNRAKRELFGKASRRIVNEKFTMDLMVRRYAEILGLEKNGKGGRKNIQL